MILMDPPGCSKEATYRTTSLSFIGVHRGVAAGEVGNYPSTLGGGYYHWLHINWFADQFYVKQ
jgi:hypothetical protein